MTTNVTIEAHCNSDEEVLISRGTFKEGDHEDAITIQDGETHITYVHDDIMVIVKEVAKRD